MSKKILFITLASILALSFVFFNSQSQKNEVPHLKSSLKKIVNPPFSTNFPQKFTFNYQQFQLNDQPFYMAAGEIHYSRVPSQYWRTRIQTIKAMGLNTLSVYMMWNFHEITPGNYDFESPDRNLRNFLQIAKEEQMYVILRPGPYVCAEWDFGGHPYYLLKEDMQLRSTDPKYIAAITVYIQKVSEIVKDYQITQNGTILMVQIENEYGSYSSDNSYPLKLHDIWVNTKNIEVPYYTADGGSLIKAGHVPGAAIGLNPGTDKAWYDYAHLLENDVPVMSSETYPGWLTHWGENWAGQDTKSVVSTFEKLVQNNWSFSMYMVYGGSNFGLYAGANNNGSDSQFQPDVTSYDYDAPINEQGQPTDKFFALRTMFQQYFSWQFPDVPTVMNTITIDNFTPQKVFSLFDLLSVTPQKTFSSPQRFEIFDQNQGIVAYTFNVNLQLGKNTINFDKIRDLSKVYVTKTKQLLGTLSRKDNQKSLTFDYSDQQNLNTQLTVIVEAYGHVNYGHDLYDPKGIIGNVYVNNKQVQGDFIHQLVPLENIPKKPSKISNDNDTETFFEGKFDLKDTVGDTYLNMKNWKRGYVWVNGFNLGRFWNIGPQFKLYCPSTILKQKDNTIVVFDLDQNQNYTINGEKTLK